MATRKFPPIVLGYVEGRARHPQDDGITKALAKARRAPGGSSDSVLAFKNAAAEVYRYEVINGLQQELELVDLLEELGLVDETAQGGRKPRGVWSVYGAGRALGLNDILAEVDANQRSRVRR